MAPWEKRGVNKRSQRQEQALAARPGGSQQLNSGRTWFSKRDVKLGGFLIEARFTDKKSYTVERDDFERLVRHAFGTPPGQLPAMQIDFNKPDSTLQLLLMRLDDHLEREQRLVLMEGEIRDLRRELAARA